MGRGLRQRALSGLRSNILFSLCFPPLSRRSWTRRVFTLRRRYKDKRKKRTKPKHADKYDRFPWRRVVLRSQGAQGRSYVGLRVGNRIAQVPGREAHAVAVKL